MSTFDDRENAFENKYAHDQELQFKVNARRNKLFGLWAAEKLHKEGEDAESYAKEVVISDFEEPGDDDVLRKVEKDLEEAGVGVSVDDLRYEMDRLLSIAKQQIAEEV